MARITRLFFCELEDEPSWTGGRHADICSSLKKNDRVILYQTGRNIRTSTAKSVAKRMEDTGIGIFIDVSGMNDDWIVADMKGQIAKCSNPSLSVFFLTTMRKYLPLADDHSGLYKTMTVSDRITVGRYKPPVPEVEDEKETDETPAQKAHIRGGSNEDLNPIITETSDMPVDNKAQGHCPPENKASETGSTNKRKEKKSPNNRKRKEKKEREEDFDSLVSVYDNFFGVAQGETEGEERKDTKDTKDKGGAELSSALDNPSQGDDGGSQMSARQNIQPDIKEEKTRSEKPGGVEKDPKKPSKKEEPKNAMFGWKHKGEDKKPERKKEEKKDADSSELSMDDLYRLIWGGQKHEREMEQKQYSELEDSKARTVSLLEERLYYSIDTLLKGFKDMNPDRSVYAELVSALISSENYTDFLYGWEIIQPQYRIPSMTEMIYQTLHDEAEYYARACEILYADDQW